MSSRDDEPASGADGLGEVAASGVVWTTVQTWASRLTGMATVIILTRLLSPDDFGIVAIAMALPPLLQPLADMGMSTYLLRAERPTEQTFSTCFWYSAIAGVVVTGLLLAAAPIVGIALNVPEVVPIGLAVAPVAFLIILGAVPMAVLRRNLRFRALAAQTVAASFVGQVVAVVLAFTGFGAWALVWQALVFQAITVVFAWSSSRFRPTFAFSRVEFIHMAKFGIKVIGNHILNPAAIWVVNALVVWFLGTATLGFLNIAQRLIVLAQELTTNALGPVTTVLFSRLRDAASDRLRAGYLRAASVSYVLVAPIMAFIAVGAPEIIPIVFGNQWGESIVPAQWLAVAGILTASAIIDSALFLTLGRPGAWLVYSVSIDACVLLVALLALPHGLGPYVVGYVGASLLATIVRCVLVGRFLSRPWWHVCAPLGRVAVPVGGAAAAASLVILLVDAPQPIVKLLMIGAVLVAVYAGLIYLLARELWVELTRLGGTILDSLRRRKRGQV